VALLQLRAAARPVAA